MSFLRALRGLLSLFIFTQLFHTVHAQRIKEGCFEASSISCDNPRVNPNEVDFSVQEVCQKLAAEIFPSDDIVFSPHLHGDYLNAIEANTEFCSQVQTSYSQCLFCAREFDFITDCIDHSFGVQCGDQPDLEQVLSDNERYAQFQTEADIDAACADMQEAYGWSFPITIELCERQTLVKHLCPGNCDGTCFPTPPSCDPNAYQGPVNQSLDTGAVCDLMSDYAFYFARMETVMNTSQHADYLRAIPSSMCDVARQAYSDCAWCDRSMCFDETNPVTCKAPDVPVESNVEDDEALCEALYFSFYDIDLNQDLFNISKHTKHLGVQNNTDLCNRARQSYHKCYWCAGDDVPLDFCLNWESNCNGEIRLPEGFVSHTLQALNITDSPEAKCAEIYDHWQKHKPDPFTLQNCYNNAYLAVLCPDYFCLEAEAAATIDKNYLGATTTTQKRALIWMSRVSAFLSFAGASFILYDIFSDPKNRRTVYHQLLVGMALFDIVTAVAWGFATAPIDKEAASHIEGAMGTPATCTAQAFFVQLGFTSVFYNVSLAVYYVLVVAYDWREFQLKKVQLYLHFLPPFVGLVLALGAIPSYHWIEYGCHILPPPEGDMWAVLVFVVLPLGFAIIAIMASMMVVYCKVRRQAAASAKWSFGVSQASALQQAVFWQCLFYVLAFLVSWPILFAVYLASVDVHGPLGLTLTVAFVAPLQGFNNFLVYIRPKLKQKKPQRRDSTNSSRASVFAMLRASRRRRTSLGSSTNSKFMDNSASMALQRNQTDESIHAFDPSVVMALHGSATAFHDSISSNRAPLSVVEEASTLEDAATHSFRLTADQELPSNNSKENGEFDKTASTGHSTGNVSDDQFNDEGLHDEETSAPEATVALSSGLASNHKPRPGLSSDASDNIDNLAHDRFDDEG